MSSWEEPFCGRSHLDTVTPLVLVFEPFGGCVPFGGCEPFGGNALAVVNLKNPSGCNLKLRSPMVAVLRP